MPRTGERTGVLLIRVWLEEENGAARLRARIIRTLDVSAARGEATIGVASEREIVNVVRAWLHAFVSGR